MFGKVFFSFEEWFVVWAAWGPAMIGVFLKLKKRSLLKLFQVAMKLVRSKQAKGNQDLGQTACGMTAGM